MDIIYFIENWNNNIIDLEILSIEDNFKFDPINMDHLKIYNITFDPIYYNKIKLILTIDVSIIIKDRIIFSYDITFDGNNRLYIISHFRNIKPYNDYISKIREFNLRKILN